MGNNRKMISLALLTAAAIGAFTGCAGYQNTSRSDQHMDDKVLQLQIRDALENNPGYRFTGVNIDVHSSAVRLSGTVDTSDQKSRAGEIAKNVQGVTTVKNNITLNSNNG
jgi:hyperosmotically inducible protein